MADLDVGNHYRSDLVAPALLVTLTAGLIRLVVAALTPLFPDEMYYWDWSRHLAVGYFDHPPAIAWLIRCGTVIAGVTPLGVRLGPAVAGIVGALILSATARRISGDRAALWAAVLFAAMPLSGAGLVLATPDAPLLAAAAATVYAVMRALEQPARSRGSLVWWCASGVAIGLGFWSKYTAVLLPVGIFIAFAVRKELRDRLREPGPYVATVIATLVFMPVILWNSSHDWASFAFQLGHGLGVVRGSVLNRELEMIGGQLGLVTPILFVMMCVAAWRAARGTVAAPVAILPIAAAFVFAFFMYSATKRRAEANWPALAYIPGTLLVASYSGGVTWNRWLRAGVALAALVTLLTYVNSFSPVLPVPAPRDPNARAAGWDDLGRSVDSLYQPARALSSHRTWLAGDRYQETAALAYEIPTHPTTFSLNIASRANQYDFWPTFPSSAQPRDALILVVDDLGENQMHESVTRLGPHFSGITRSFPVQLNRKGELVKRLRVWQLDGWKGSWPSK